jgi:hypothetical protein
MRNREITMRNRKLCSRTTFRSVLGVAAAAAALLAVPNWASAQNLTNAQEEAFVQYGSLANPGAKSFDISWVDSMNRLYFLADRSNFSVDIVAIGPNPAGLAILSMFRLVPPGGSAFAGPNSNSNLAGPNGVITFTNPKSGTPELWVGDGPTADAVCGSGSCSTVKVFDVAHGNTPSHTISTGGSFRADELCFGDTNPGGTGGHFVLMANDAEVPSPWVTIINTDTYQVVTKIVFNGGVVTNTAGVFNVVPNATNGIEQCQFDPTSNKFILNIPEVSGPGNDTQPGAVVEIDPNNLTTPVTGYHMVPIADCAGPQGMAIAWPAVSGDDRVLLGCNAVSPVSAGGNGLQNSVIVDLEELTNGTNGNAYVKNTLANQGGADEVWYNPGDNHYLLALGSHNPEMLGVIDSSSSSSSSVGCCRNGTIDVDVTIGPGGSAPGNRQHSVAADAVTNLVAVPIAPNGNGFTSTVCGSNTLGCIAIFGPNLFDSNEWSE